MKVKAVDIARELGISKATVSLALNDKPGVSEQTRQNVLACREKLAHRGRRIESKSPEKQIKIIFARKDMNIFSNKEVDLETDVMAVYDREVKKRGYNLGISYFNALEDSLDDLVQECNSDMVAGIILHATELNSYDLEKFEQISKPMVIYDNESVNSVHTCVVADNYQGVQRAVDCLIRNGISDIIYLSHGEDIYNFDQRRKGFCDFMRQAGITDQPEKKIIETGIDIESAYKGVLSYLDSHNLPEAFITENYQISIGAVRAFHEKHISIPDNLSLIGVDSIPEYLTGGMKMTSVRIPHAERALLAMYMLDREIALPRGIKSKVMADCRLENGESVKQKAA